MSIAIIDKEKHIKICQTLKDANLDELAIDIYNYEIKDIDYILKNSKLLYKMWNKKNNKN